MKSFCLIEDDHPVENDPDTVEREMIDRILERELQRDKTLEQDVRRDLSYDTTPSTRNLKRTEISSVYWDERFVCLSIDFSTSVLPSYIEAQWL